MTFGDLSLGSDFRVPGVDTVYRKTDTNAAVLVEDLVDEADGPPAEQYEFPASQPVEI